MNHNNDGGRNNNNDGGGNRNADIGYHTGSVWVSRPTIITSLWGGAIDFKIDFEISLHAFLTPFRSHTHPLKFSKVMTPIRDCDASTFQEIMVLKKLIALVRCLCLRRFEMPPWDLLARFVHICSALFPNP